MCTVYAINIYVCSNVFEFGEMLVAVRRTVNRSGWQAKRVRTEVGFAQYVEWSSSLMMYMITRTTRINNKVSNSTILYFYYTSMLRPLRGRACYSTAYGRQQ